MIVAGLVSISFNSYSTACVTKYWTQENWSWNSKSPTNSYWIWTDCMLCRGDWTTAALLPPLHSSECSCPTNLSFPSSSICCVAFPGVGAVLKGKLAKEKKKRKNPSHPLALVSHCLLFCPSLNPFIFCLLCDSLLFSALPAFCSGAE